MKEKERYMWSQDFNQECTYEEFDYIVDSETGKVLDDFDIKDLLNQQDEEIKDLQNDNEWLCNERERLIKYVDKLIDEYKQLKQPQK